MWGAIVEIVLDIAAWLFKYFRSEKPNCELKNQVTREDQHVEDVTEIVRGVDADRAGVLLGSFPGDKVRKATAPKVK